MILCVSTSNKHKRNVSLKFLKRNARIKFYQFLMYNSNNFQQRNYFQDSIIIFIFKMSIRRGWTIQQDRVLKLLKEERKIKKWSSIAKIMDFQFNMCGRNGKQCRERYNNHLDQKILQQKLNIEEQKLLENLNDQIGNKWSVITKAFRGRTANYLKNQLYSKLRKSIRKLNKFIKESKMKQVKPYKLNIVYKIVQSNDFKIFEKQRHTVDDLNFYADIKEKLFRYAQQPLNMENQDSLKMIQQTTQSRQIISKLNLFAKKYDALHKKLKKPRKRYFCEDDIILNSLSNNKIIQETLNNQNEQMSEQNLEQNSSQSQSDKSSETSDKKQNQVQESKPKKIQIKVFGSKNFDNYHDKDFLEKDIENTPKVNQKNNGNQKQLEKAANQNCKIVEQADMDQHQNQNQGYHLLQQSEQCQFMDIQYLEHFKSCSFIDESLFQ